MRPGIEHGMAAPWIALAVVVLVFAVAAYTIGLRAGRAQLLAEQAAAREAAEGKAEVET